MTDDWAWDETLFAGSAPYYARGRLPYAPGIGEALARALQLDGRGRMIDVGCGPGIIALMLAPLFQEVVGVDPDAGMLSEAERRATEQTIANARWVRGRGEDLPLGLGTFRVATFAASFHWMNRPLVAGLVRQMFEPGGAFVQLTNTAYVGRLASDSPHKRAADDAETAEPLPHPLPPYDEINEIVRRYLGPLRRAGQGVRTSSPDDEELVLERAGFAPAEKVWVKGVGVVLRTRDDIVAHYFSTSSSAPHLFGDRVDAFEAEVCRALAEASPSGLFAERTGDTELRIWRR